MIVSHIDCDRRTTCQTMGKSCNSGQNQACLAAPCGQMARSILQKVTRCAILLLLGMNLNCADRASTPLASPAVPDCTIPRIAMSKIRRQELRELLTRLAPGRVVRQQRMHAVVHALRLWGPNAEFFSETYFDSYQMHRILLTTHGFHEFLPNVTPFLVRTREGVATMVGNDFSKPAHTDKILSVCAECGLGLSTRIEVGGETLALEDLLKDAVGRFQLEQQELEWTAIALSSYLAPRTSWTNRFGQQYCFDQLAVQLLERPLNQGPCYGTHKFYALAWMLRINDQRGPIFGDRLARRAREQLRQIAELLRQNQFASGLWVPDWDVPIFPVQRQEKHPDILPKNLVRVTGHHLEWLAIAPLDCIPEGDWLERAATATLIFLRARSELDTLDEYGPTTHAARARFAC